MNNYSLQFGSSIFVQIVFSLSHFYSIDIETKEKTSFFMPCVLDFALLLTNCSCASCKTHIWASARFSQTLEGWRTYLNPFPQEENSVSLTIVHYSWFRPIHCMKPKRRLSFTVIAMMIIGHTDHNTTTGIGLCDRWGKRQSKRDDQ